jgi:predicted RNase H-like HicB family nuclease
MERNPLGWTIRDIETICGAHRAVCAPPRGGGSHDKVSKPGKLEILTIPFKRTIKPVYIRKLVALSAGLKIMGEHPRYKIVIEPLSEEDGGGFLATVPDLPGCMSDGETEFEAIQNVHDAIACWIEAADENGRAIPAPAHAARPRH